MAFTAALDVDVGDATKETDYDPLADNAEFNQSKADVDHDFTISTGTGYHRGIHTAGTHIIGSATSCIIWIDTAQDLRVKFSSTTTPPTPSGNTDGSRIIVGAGASQFDGTVTVGVDDTGYDVKFFGATSGAYCLWDESADDLKLVGAAGLTVAGTSALTVLTASGTSQFNSTVTVGVDDTGYDVKFFGATASAYCLWDESADDLILAGAAGLTVAGTSALTVLTASTITGSGVLSIDDATDSTSTTTGSIHTDGGIGVAKNIIVGVNVGIGEATPDEMLHLTSSVSQGTKIKLEDTNAGADSAVFEFNKNSSSPADNDFLGEIEFRGNNSTPSEYRYGRIFCKSTDVTAGTENSEMSFNVFSNGASKVGTLSTLGVWTDESGAKGKAYEGAPKEVWQGGVLDRIRNLFVSRYHHAHIPEWKEILERHISPSAEDFYDLFGAGTDPRKIRKNQKGQDIVPVPGIAPKDLAGVALIGIQELIDEVDVMKSEIAALKEMA
jgi:hypothetical protein